MAGNVFDQFITTENKKIKVEALGGEEVTIRDLTVAERKVIDLEMMKDAVYQEKGQVRYKPTSYQSAQILAVSYALVEPKMSVQKINKLSSSANEAIFEIAQVVLSDDDATEEKVRKK